MASVTRSTRRGEPSRQTPSQEQQQQKGQKLQPQEQQPPQGDTTTNSTTMHSRTAVLHQAPNGGGGVGGRIGRTKRSLDENDFDAIKHKRSRFSVDILAKPRVINHAGADKASPPTIGGPAAAAKQQQHKPPTTINNTTFRTTNTIPRISTTVVNNENKQDQQQQQQQQQPLTKQPINNVPATAKHAIPGATKKESKAVVNGMKQEKLKPKTAETKTEGRKLRSQEATKFKSELAAYFPDYDEVIGNEQKQQHLLNIDTPILIVDTSATVNGVPPPSNYVVDPFQQPFKGVDQLKPRGYGDDLFTTVWGAQVIDLGFLEPQLKLQAGDDPLPDSAFVPVHKRAERAERSIRNTEKGRAQHEKDRIIHLLEGLQGHDWLRVMGVSGVTETKKKEFQPARQYFMKGCQGILDKFRNWTLEEKRRKVEKARALAEQAGDDSSSDNDGSSEKKDEEDEDEEDEGEGEEDDSEHEAPEPVEEGASAGGVSETSSPAKQLRDEALARSKLSKTVKKPRGMNRLLPPPKPLAPPKEFKSFYSKRHEREAALAPRQRTLTRRGGRKSVAWGQPIPELPESDFMLPAEYRDEDTLRLRARKKRREKRHSGQ